MNWVNLLPVGMVLICLTYCIGIGWMLSLELRIARLERDLAQQLGRQPKGEVR